MRSAAKAGPATPYVPREGIAPSASIQVLDMRTCAIIHIHYCPYALPRCLHHDLQTRCRDSHQPHSTCECKESRKSLLQLRL